MRRRRSTYLFHVLLNLLRIPSSVSEIVCSSWQAKEISSSFYWFSVCKKKLTGIARWCLNSCNFNSAEIVFIFVLGSARPFNWLIQISIIYSPPVKCNMYTSKWERMSAAKIKDFLQSFFLSTFDMSREINFIPFSSHSDVVAVTGAEDVLHLRASHPLNQSETGEKKSFNDVVLGNKTSFHDENFISLMTWKSLRRREWCKGKSED